MKTDLAALRDFMIWRVNGVTHAYIFLDYCEYSDTNMAIFFHENSFLIHLDVVSC